MTLVINQQISKFYQKKVVRIKKFTTEYAVMYFVLFRGSFNGYTKRDDIIRKIIGF